MTTAPVSMKLTRGELACIAERLETYHIIYQEVYDEIADHFISAIEFAREHGDQRPVGVLFDEIVETQFPGKHAIQKIVAKYVFAYNRKVRKTMQANMVFYLSPRAILLIMAVVALGFYLPPAKWTFGIMFSLLIITANVPVIYTFRKMKGIKNTITRTSLIKSFVFGRARNLTLILTLLLNIIGFAARRWHIDFLNPLHYPPVIYTLLLSFFIIYGLSSMRLCRQELRLRES